MKTVGINWAAVGVAMALNMVVGFVWYSVLFGVPWMAAVGKSMGDFGHASPAIYLWPLLGSVVEAIVLWGVMSASSQTTVEGGLVWACFLWLAFVFMPMGTTNTFGMFPFALTLINAGQELVRMAVIGAVLGAMRPRVSAATSA